MTTPKPTFAVGQTVRCVNEPEQGFYRYLGNNQVGWYPTQWIMHSYFPDLYTTPGWFDKNSKDTDCSKFTRAPSVIYNMKVGDKLGCDYQRIDNNTCASNRYTYLGGRKIACNTDWDWQRDDAKYSNKHIGECVGMELGPPMKVDETVPPSTSPSTDPKTMLLPPPSISMTVPPTFPPPVIQGSTPAPEESGGLSTGAIVGIVIGVIVFFVAVGVAMSKGKSKKSES